MSICWLAPELLFVVLIYTILPLELNISWNDSMCTNAHLSISFQWGQKIGKKAIECSFANIGLWNLVDESINRFIYETHWNLVVTSIFIYDYGSSVHLHLKFVKTFPFFFHKSIRKIPLQMERFKCKLIRCESMCKFIGKKMNERTIANRKKNGRKMRCFRNAITSGVTYKCHVSFDEHRKSFRFYGDMRFFLTFGLYAIVSFGSQ